MPTREGLPSNTSNAFALVLAFYEDHRVCKLNPEDLGKIARKYGTRPNSLLKDLKVKYGQAVPFSIPLAYLNRLLAIYDVPSDYKNLLPEARLRDVPNFAYMPALDINSVEFKPEALFRENRIIGPEVPITLYDNLLKSRHTLFPDIFTHNPNPTQDRTLIEKAKEVSKEQRARTSLLNRIAQVAVYNAAMGNIAHAEEELQKRRAQSLAAVEAYKRGEDVEMHLDDRKGVHASARPSYLNIPTSGPKTTTQTTKPLPPSVLDLLARLMHGKLRAFVVLRCRSCISGCLVGFVRGFDRHCNLLLTDVDEERVSIHCSKRTTTVKRTAADVRTKVGIGAGAGTHVESLPDHRNRLFTENRGITLSPTGVSWPEPVSHRNACYLAMPLHRQTLAKFGELGPAITMRNSVSVPEARVLDSGDTSDVVFMLDRRPLLAGSKRRRCEDDIVLLHHSQLLVRGDSVVSISVAQT